MDAKHSWDMMSVVSYGLGLAVALGLVAYHTLPAKWACEREHQVEACVLTYIPVPAEGEGK